MTEMKWNQDVAKVLYDDLMRSFAFDGMFYDKAVQAMIEAGLESG